MLVLSALLSAGLAAASVLPASLDAVPGALVNRDAGGGTCVGPDFVNVTIVGAPGPYSCESDWGKGYLPITNLTFWSSSTAVIGFQIEYSDGTLSKVIGTMSKTREVHIGLNYGQGDKFSKAWVYGHVAVKGTTPQHLGLETIKGNSIRAGTPAGTSSLQRVQPTGIGILFGIQYTINSAGNLGSLGFVFLEPAITEIQISNIQFPNGPVGASDNIYPRTIGKAHFYNNASEPQTYQFNNQLVMTETYTFMQALTLTFTVQEAIAFEFDLNLLDVVPKFTTTTTFIWTVSETTTLSAAFTNTEQVQYNAQVTLDPNKGVDCFAVAGQGAGTFFYTSLVTLSLKNGNSYTFPENGYLTVQAISQGEVSCTDANHP